MVWIISNDLQVNLHPKDKDQNTASIFSKQILWPIPHPWLANADFFILAKPQVSLHSYTYVWYNN